MLLCSGHDYSVDTAPGTVMAFVLEPSLLEREIDLLNVSRPRNWSLRSLQLPLSSKDAAAWPDLIRLYGKAADRAEGAPGSDDLRGVEDRFASWLARRIVAASGLVELSPSSRQVVERVDAWIRANVAQPMSLDELRTVAGVSARTLLSSGQAPTVTTAALRSGFSHLGRFSVVYKRTFGEAPSETLARNSAVTLRD
jgi:AraC-like DNA-binding protein